MDQKLDYIDNYNLPNGGIYSGQCKKNGMFIELKGKGEAHYPNGASYYGSFNYGRPYGLGKYKFTNGDFHWGYFDDIPNGVGFVNEHGGFTLGMFTDGELHGWAIKFYNNLFQFGWWHRNQLIQDESNKVLWIRAMITQRLRLAKEAHLIQVGKESQGFIRFGFPNTKYLNRITGKENTLPSVGFKFLKDGQVIVGEFFDTEITGNLVIYKNDKSCQYGYWGNAVLLKPYSLQDFQSSGEYFVDGLNVIPEY